MKITVIKVTKDGKVGYLRSSSIFCGEGGPIAESPISAINYALPENSRDLEQDLSDLRLSEDEIYARSGVLVDSAEVVEIEISWQEVSVLEVRKPHKCRV